MLAYTQSLFVNESMGNEKNTSEHCPHNGSIGVHTNSQSRQVEDRNECSHEKRTCRARLVYMHHLQANC